MAAPPAAAPKAAMSMKEYLKRYESGYIDAKNLKKAKKKKARTQTPSSVGAGVVVLDEDPVWQKPVNLDEPEPSSDEEKPQVDEDIEVVRLKRLEAIRAARPYHAISEDGSGWVAVSEQATRTAAVDAGRDLSPPRQRRPRFDTPSPDREQEKTQDAASARKEDLSSLRQHCRRLDTPSPDRKEARSPERDASPPRRRRYDSEEPLDLSPPRRRKRNDSVGGDAKRISIEGDGNAEPLDDRDISPPRRGQRAGSNISPPRRVRRGSIECEGNAELRRQKRSGSAVRDAGFHVDPSDDGDLSPPRRVQSVGSDFSPPRKVRRGSIERDGDVEPRTRKRNDSVACDAKRSDNGDLSPPRRRVGLVTREQHREETRRKMEEEKAKIAALDPSLIGKDAKPIFRDKEGRRVLEADILKANEEEKPKEKKIEWGKGLKQKREEEARALEIEREKERPFARSRDDPELDKMLKDRLRWGDPMAHLVKRKNSDIILEDFGENEKMKESGFIVPQSIPSHSWLKRGVDCPPNRYGIKPGRHWDGVDRSNGYEKEIFKRQNEKQASQREAYLWSVSEM